MTSAWPAFRHDALHTGRSDLAGPSSPTLGWSRQVGGGMSSPAVGPDAVYVLGSAGLVAMKLAGDQLWTYPCGGVGRPSPAIAASGVIYVASSDGGLYAINADGTLRWRRTLPGASDASPTVGPDGTVYIGCSAGKFQAYTSSGTLKYTYSVAGGRSIQSSAALASDGTTYFGCDDGCLYALKPDGTLKWKFTTNPLGAIAASPAVGSDGTIYFGTTSGYFYGVYPGGTQRFRAAAGVSASSPAIASDGTIYFGSQDGSLYALSKVGSLRWKHATGGSIGSSPAVDSNGTVYVGSDDGSIYAVSPSGSRLWQYGAGAAVASSPAIGDSRSLYVLVADGTLRRLSADTTPPDVPAVTDDGEYSTMPSALHASWNSFDAESGISRYEYAIGTAPGAGDVAPFADAGTDTAVTRDGLPLVKGARYYFSVRAINGAGLASEVGVSDGITVDYTAPQTPIVTDDGAYSTLPMTLHASWSSSDQESGVVGYEYAIGTAPESEDLVPFTDAGAANQVTRDDLPLVNGTRYYISVRATNRAGLVSYIGVSNGIMVDYTSPQTPVVIDDGKYTTSADTLHFVFGSGDTESGIDHYEYSVGTTEGLTDVLAWQQASLTREHTITTLSLAQGASYYINVRAHNRAGLVSEGCSNGILVDRTPPAAPGIQIVSVSLAEIRFRVSASDPESGVSQTQYAVLTSPDASSAQWVDCQLEDIVAVQGDFGGSPRYVAARARNGAGLWSQPTIQQAVADPTPPTTPIVSDDGDSTSVADSLHASFLAADAESGVTEYAYCIGTSPGASDVIGWTSIGPIPSATACLALQSGVTYYFGAKACNGVGLWSAVGVSDGIEYHSQASVWPKFHLDPANSGRSGVNACLSGRLHWRVQTEGYIESSPAFAGDGTVYIGSADGRLYAIGTNGAVRWSYQTGGAIDSSPAVGPNGRVYVGSCDRYLYCIQPNGTLDWRFAATGAIWSSPCIGADGVIYFGTQDGWFYAVKTDGTLKWKYSTGGAIWSSPALATDGSIYFACENGKLYALTATGGMKWAYQTGTAADSSPSVAESGVICFGSGDGYFYAINPNGTLRWRVYTGQLVDSSPAIGPDGTIYVGTGGAGYSGSMRAYSPSGVELWRMPLVGGVRSSPALDARGTLYFGTADGKLYALRSGGTALWVYSPGQSVLSSPAIGPDGQVVVGADDGGIYCFKDYPQDGTPPTRPVVTPAQVFLPKGAPLAFSWSATDPESGIENYSFAIGTQPGLSDIAHWTNAGIATSATRPDLALAIGQSYYVSVTARNHVGLVSEVGSSPAVTVVADNPVNLIGDAKKRPAGTRVNLPGKLVTAVFADCIFIEEPDRTSGIRCLVGSSDLSIGAVVDALGRIAFQNGETVLSEAAFSRLGVASSIAPVAASVKSVIGPGIDMAGLLVRVTGRVTKAGAYYFVITDGSKLDSPRGVKGIEVRAGAGDVPPVGAYVSVTGVVSREVVNGASVTVVRASPGSCLMVLP